MGLIAREIESRGIATLSLSSALSITASANPPRAAYVDYPLGHTAGKADDTEDQRAILRAALEAFQTITAPGTIVDLGRSWSDDDSWKDRVMRPSPASGGAAGKASDDRVARLDEPQYQSEDDATAADATCDTCVFLEDPRA